jgi:tetratricopeptide (TPR) repeat protein
MHGTIAAEEHYRRGKELLEAGDESAAYEHFQTAATLAPHCPRYQSYYGLGLALVDRRFHRAVEICRAAAKEEFFNPEVYHNLARVHLAFGFKAEGIRFLRRGLMIDPVNEGLRGALARLGLRQLPVLRFLPRGHLVNRLLGRVRERIRATTAEGSAESSPA